MNSIDTVELSKALLTASLTVTGGVVVFVVSQWLLKVFIEPLHEFSRTVGEISIALVCYANVYPGTTSAEETLETAKVLRQLAARLLSCAYVIHGYDLLVLLGLIPKRSQLNEAVNGLFILSTSISHDPFPVVDENRTNIRRLLRIKPLK